MSSSNQGFASVFPVPVSVFQYPSTGSSVTSLPRVERSADREGDEADSLRAGITLTEEAIAARMSVARAEATYQTEQRLRQEYETRLAAEAEKIAATVRAFDRERGEYFARVEREIVQLALSIAGKILHREAQVEPMLVAALVRIALGQLKDGSTVSIRVRPEEAARWRTYFQSGPQNLTIAVVEDAELGPCGCLLETELGTANFSLDAQLKEVEQGFFDVLAQRP